MRILAIEVEKSGVIADDFRTLLEEEAQFVWKLQQENFIREIYFRADRNESVLMLECDNIQEAGKILTKLPLVSAGVIDFELIPLRPYPGFARLFAVKASVDRR
jgi:muconolactone delta-isomerase